MKIYFLLFVFLVQIITVKTNAQSVSELDRKNGLVNFKFGTSPSSYKGKITKSEIQPKSDMERHYDVTDMGLKEVLGFKAQSITLFFIKNKLWAIDVEYPQETSDDIYDVLKYKLERLFGNKSFELNEDKMEFRKVITGQRWDGQKTKLDIMKSFIYRNSEYQVSIFYTSTTIDKEGYKSEF